MTTDQRCDCYTSGEGTVQCKMPYGIECPLRQPTHTSSLEEARTLEYEREIRMDRYARDWIQAAREDPERRTDVTGEILLRIIRLERAAARAEVIREVEAVTATVKDAQHLLRFVASDVKPRDVPAIMRVLASAEVTHEDCCSEQGIAALRALSQGGEGKA